MFVAGLRPARLANARFPAVPARWCCHQDEMCDSPPACSLSDSAPIACISNIQLSPCCSAVRVSYSSVNVVVGLPIASSILAGLALGLHRLLLAL